MTKIRTRAELTNYLAEGGKVEYIYFWGHKSRTTYPHKGVCSQWWLSPFPVDGVAYATAEHWMMVCKAKLFGDLAIIPQMLATLDPAAVKKLGQQVSNYDDETWAAARFECVVQGNVHKFSQYPELQEWLLNTGDKVLVEASPYDRIWGIGLTENHKDVQHPKTWRGENLLGFAIMEARERLRKTL